MDSNPATIEPEFNFIGGNLCLDFANTVGGLPPDSISQERLTSYPHLVAWSQQANLTSESEAHVLLHKAENAQVEAIAILERARALREALYGIFAAVARGTQPTGSDLDWLNRELERGMAGARVIVTSDGFGWEWRKDEGAFDQMLAPVARSAATLLTSTERQFVRECANEQCQWLFVDTTKNHRRQWCSTTGCGNVMRVRKYRERQLTKENSVNDL
ncbi:MAG: ABATE domain-containing protein [Chitinophagaceae bacterium]|nr:ABATE domain-containing protein [Anaerolineae bacterium]